MLVRNELALPSERQAVGRAIAISPCEAARPRSHRKGGGRPKALRKVAIGGRSTEAQRQPPTSGVILLNHDAARLGEGSYEPGSSLEAGVAFAATGRVSLMRDRVVEEVQDGVVRRPPCARLQRRVGKSAGQSEAPALGMRRGFVHGQSIANEVQKPNVTSARKRFGGAT